MKKIYINAGHSNVDPGAVSYETERKLTVKISDFMASYLRDTYECEVIRPDGNLEEHLAQVCADANSRKADLFVSNHFNAGGGDGFECFVYSESRRPLGNLFEKHAKAVGQNSRGVKVKQYYVLKNSNMPAVLTETAFVDNKKDISDWNDDHELKRMGEAYAKAAAEFLNLPVKKVAPKPAPTPVTKTYSQVDFVKDIQRCFRVSVDGIAGKQTLNATITISSILNPKHTSVYYIQKYLKTLGYNEVGTVDGVAGGKFTTAIKHFQKDHKLVQDGEITARCGTWKTLLGYK